MTDNEMLIRQAIAAEANEAVDPRAVMAELQKGKPRKKKWPLALVAAGVVAAAVAAVAVTVPHATPVTQPAAAQPATEQNILLVGVDDNQIADSVVLANVKPNGDTALVSLPRDIRIDGDTKLKQLLASGGMEKLTAAVTTLTGLHVDHYAVVTMKGMQALGNAVGGVEVCLKAAVMDSFSGADFPAGRQMLSGDQALAFVRQRHGLPNGDLDRVVRQQAFLKGIAKKALTKPARLPEVIDLVQKNVRVDAGWDMLEFAKRFTASPAVRAATIPVGATHEGPTGSGLDVDPQAVREFARTFTSSAAPTGSGTPAPGDGCIN
ncbi:LytR family transcriptional regulator [Solihabitans fulvus]|uniref:LytR family transcriptional regulator n=1 Tax=Solihabitans fulvus TaxID=1892852 RepID=A0A5B2XIX7_9PSEU|nr:LCP family protein [Solihabitans fulvus]KAA2262959.1 LytR family transcriptional regulator [Solihabitans fulvus]